MVSNKTDSRHFPARCAGTVIGNILYAIALLSAPVYQQAGVDATDRPLPLLPRVDCIAGNKLILHEFDAETNMTGSCARSNVSFLASSPGSSASSLSLNGRIQSSIKINSYNDEFIPNF